MKQQQVIKQQPILALTLPINPLKVSQHLDNQISFNLHTTKLPKRLELETEPEQRETIATALRRKPDGQTEHLEKTYKGFGSVERYEVWRFQKLLYLRSKFNTIISCNNFSVYSG